MGRYHNDILDRYLAPQVSRFTEADIPILDELQAVSRHWIGNHFLNSVWRRAHPEGRRQMVFNFLRRADAAIEEYVLAKAATLEFLQGGGQAVRAYTVALHHWETCLERGWLAARLFQKIFGVEKLFDKGDGSHWERLNRLQNDAKHTDARIEAGEHPGGSPLVVWMENDGMRSLNAAVSWQEIVDFLHALRLCADIVEDPLTMKDKLEQLRAERDADGLLEAGDD